jgi:hypothetical protein
MKFFVRRLLAGIVIVPFVGLVYSVGCVMLIAYGAGSNGNTFADYFGFGMVLGVGFTLLFAFDALRRND